MSGEILTANELISGATVYLSAEDAWIEDIDQARVFGEAETEERDDAIMKAKADHRLIGIEIEKAERVGEKVVAERLRERIRAEGPTSPRQEPQHLGEDSHVPV